MKIAIRAGHNELAYGATGILDEVVESRKLLKAVIPLLQSAGHSVLDCTQGRCNKSVDVIKGVDKANDWGADIFVSLHFNNAYKEYQGRLGTEVLVFNTSKSNTAAKRVLDKISNLGFKFRGIVGRTDLHELKATNMTAMIVEVCFVEATEDAKLYKNLGPNKIAKAIAEGIIGSTINTDSSSDLNTSVSVKVNDSVKVKRSAKKYATGESISSFVYDNTYKITKISGAKALLSEINSWIMIQDLELVNVQKYGVVFNTGGSGLNVRKTASTSGTVIGSLKEGEKVKLGYKSGEWWNIYFGTNGGFVHGKYIKI